MKHEILITEKMKKEGLSDLLIQDFLTKVEKVRTGETGKVKWETIGDLDPDKDEIDLEVLRKKYPIKKETLSKLVVIKLNGGLGTSMGLEKAKSLIPIKDGLSFLKIVANQVKFMRKKYGVEIPLILMNSYNTEADSLEELKKSDFTQEITTSFLQNKVPRLNQSDLTPITLSDKKEEWCPPGHGMVVNRPTGGAPFIVAPRPAAELGASLG